MMNDVTVKLNAFVNVQVFNDLQGDAKVLENRINTAEEQHKEHVNIIRDHNEKLDNNRKRI